MFFEFWIGKSLRQEISDTLIFSRSWNENLRDSGIPLLRLGLPISKTADIHSSELPVCGIGDY